jgi:RNA polymerase sigma-70 factor, ECF subfamily
LVQETLVEALKSFHRFKPCHAWLLSILRHIRSNRLRAGSRLSLVRELDDRIAETIPFVPPVPQQVADEDMLAALRRIPEQYQEVIILCDVEEMTYKEVAEALGVPVGTVMSRLHRGRVLLRAELSQRLREIVGNPQCRAGESVLGCDSRMDRAKRGLPSRVRREEHRQPGL